MRVCGVTFLTMNKNTTYQKIFGGFGEIISDLHVLCFFVAADFCGEKLAWFFGITTPKYQSAIDEYHRMKEEVGL